jgi:hypothetical protein
VPAAIAQPSAVASRTSGTRTGRPVTSLRIWLHSAPLSRRRQTPGCQTSRRKTAKFAPGYRQRQSPRSLPARGTGWLYCIFPGRWRG